MAPSLSSASLAASLRRAAPWGLAAALGLGLALGAAPAAAHAGSSKRIQAEMKADGAALRVEVDALDAAVALGLGLSLEPEELEPHAALVQAWLGRGLRLEGESGPCVPRASEPVLVAEGDQAALAVVLDYACPAPMGAVVLHDDTVFDRDPAHETFVSVRGPAGWEARVLRSDSR